MLDKSRKGYDAQFQGLLELLMFWGLVRTRNHLPPRLSQKRDKLWEDGENLRDPILRIVRLVRLFVSNDRTVRMLWWSIGKYHRYFSFPQSVTVFVEQAWHKFKKECGGYPQNSKWRQLFDDISSQNMGSLCFYDIATMVALDLAERQRVARIRRVKREKT